MNQKIDSVLRKSPILFLFGITLNSHLLNQFEKRVMDTVVLSTSFFLIVYALPFLGYIFSLIQVYYSKTNTLLLIRCSIMMLIIGYLFILLVPNVWAYVLGVSIISYSSGIFICEIYITHMRTLRSKNYTIFSRIAVAIFSLFFVFVGFVFYQAIQFALALYFPNSFMLLLGWKIPILIAITFSILIGIKAKSIFRLETSDEQKLIDKKLSDEKTFEG